MSTTKSLSVIDPCNRTGKIVVPMEHVCDTKGVSDFLKFAANPPPDAKDLSLCLLFQKGRCNAAARCNQVHVAPEFIEKLREQSKAVKSCCANHGDVHSTQLQARRLVHVQTDEGVNSYSLGDVAFTEALEVAMKRVRGDGPIRVLGTRICRLHQRSSCKFGRDCKNIHLCPAATPLPQVEATPKRTVEAPQRVPLGIVGRPVAVEERSPAVTSCCEKSETSSTSEYCAESVTTSARKPFLSFLTEFRSVRVEEDPLDLLDNESSGSMSGHDFDAFIVGLVENTLEPISSPSWLC